MIDEYQTGEHINLPPRTQTWRETNASMHTHLYSQTHTYMLQSEIPFIKALHAQPLEENWGKGETCCTGTLKWPSELCGHESEAGS